MFYQGALSEEGLLVYLRVLHTFLSQLPVSPASASCHDSASDSEEESEEADKPSSPVSPVPCIWGAAMQAAPWDLLTFCPPIVSVTRVRPASSLCREAPSAPLPQFVMIGNSLFHRSQYIYGSVNGDT